MTDTELIAALRAEHAALTRTAEHWAGDAKLCETFTGKAAVMREAAERMEALETQHVTVAMKLDFARDCEESGSEDACGECLACKQVTINDLVQQRAALLAAARPFADWFRNDPTFAAVGDDAHFEADARYPTVGQLRRLAAVVEGL